MTTTLTPARLRTASTSVFVVFVLNGFNFASWASRLPAIRDGLRLDAGQMGLLLLVGAAGSLLALPLSGVAVHRFGARRTVAVFAAANSGGLTIAAFGVHARSVAVVAVALLIFGMGTGVWDAAMNLEGAAVEQRLGHTIMPRFHAGFSFGTVAASGVSVVVAQARVPVVVHVPVAVLASFVCVLVAIRGFLPDGSEHTAPSAVADTLADPATSVPAAPAPRHSFDAWTESRTLLIGLVVLAAALTEGAANDWVSLAVVDGFHTSHAVGAFSFGVFVTAMTAMRLFGTRLLDRLGRVAVLRVCAGLALVGLLVFGLAPSLWLTCLGVAVWGFGAALGFPVGMSAAADDPVRAAARVAVVSTIGYSAFLAGPPLLGLLAQHVGYRHAMLAIVVPVLAGLIVVGAAAPLAKTRAEPVPDAG